MDSRKPLTAQRLRNCWHCASPRKTLRDRCAQLEAENWLLRAKLGASK